MLILRRFGRFISPVACVYLLATCTPLASAEVSSPLSPAESLRHFQLEPGLTIELVACEPEVIDPIAIRFDEDGRLWVVEMRDYPNGPRPGESPLSKIRLLKDRDGDGRYETSRTFAEGLLFPTGIQPWKGGLIVTLAGEVIYLKDNDGNGTADQREVWFRGFVAENPQLRANHPRFGLDNRITIANGLRGGSIVNLRRPDEKPVSISGMDFSFDPRTGDSEADSGNGQFGLAFDDFGNRFVCNNRAPVQHVVLENRYLARNPFLAVAKVVQDVAPMSEHSRVFPLVSAWTTSNLHAGQFTAACGVEIYRGDALGDVYRGNAFVCEPTGSLVHREVLESDGVSFKSRPAVEGKEFLATYDAWFRPVNLEVGPDGALYVVDMYRAVIEHPQFMPSELQQRPDLRLGDDRGRIYRIVPAGSKSNQSRPQLSTKTSGELFDLLGHKNAWWRETAARLLFERQDTTIEPALKRMVIGAPEPTARVAALWVASGLGVLSDETILISLDDTSPRVREQALALADSRLAVSPILRPKVLLLAKDSDARVRFHAALAIGGLASNEGVPALASAAIADSKDVWMRQAVATALPQHIGPLLLAVLASPQVQSAALDSSELMLVRELATVVGSRRDESEVGQLLANLCQSSNSTSPAAECSLLGVAQGLERRGVGLVAFASTNKDRGNQIMTGLTSLFERAAVDAADEQLSEPARAHKLSVLKYARSEQIADGLLRLVSHDESQVLRSRAAEALTGQPGEAIGPALLETFATQTPTMRRAIVDALIGQAGRAQLLLNAVEAKQIDRVELDAGRANRLLQHADAAVRQRAKAILAVSPPAERTAVLKQYQAALAMTSDPVLGKELFRKHCSACHHIGDVGVDVAPDISDSRVKTPQQLLTDILNPNQAIDNNYVSYTVITHDGQVVTGIIAAETASSITLKQQENKSIDLLRADIETIRSNGVSLMPEGFEKNLSLADLANLISFVKNWRYLEQPIPGTLAPTAR